MPVVPGRCDGAKWTRCQAERPGAEKGGKGSKQTARKNTWDQPGLLEMPEGEFLLGSGSLQYETELTEEEMQNTC